MNATRQTLFLDTFSGISGDMFLGLLVDLGISTDDLRGHLETLGLPGWSIAARREKRRGIEGSRVIIGSEEGHHHRTWEDIRHLIEKSPLDPDIRHRAVKIFQRIATAEAKIHGVAEEQVHFHEVGAVDSIIDIVGSAVGLSLLGSPEVISTPLPFSTGTVRCAHGQYPLPAPATLEILKGQPLIDSGLSHELVTPTGAAIAVEVASFTSFPDMIIAKTGYGVGNRDMIERPNLLRGILGHRTTPSLQKDRVAVVETHLDDSNGEWLGALMEHLLENGALDVSFTPIQMKKNRPGVKLTVISEPWNVPNLSRSVLRETSAIGVRIHSAERLKLRREKRIFASSLGQITLKLVFDGENILRLSPEFECCRHIARQMDMPLPEVYRLITEEADKKFRPKKNI
jgi:hypothetical protein